MIFWQNVDIMISETKLDNNCLNEQFIIEGFNESIRLDRNRNGEGTLFSITEDIPTKVFPLDFLLT